MRQPPGFPIGFSNEARFEHGFSGHGYPSQAGATYTVRSDRETLYAVAQAVWGDRSLWYLIAEANGLQANATLKAGQLLFIPNKVVNIHNNSQTWRPYNAGEAIGPTDPMLPYNAAPAAAPFASADALQGQPSALLEQALAQLTTYNPEDNPANWGSGGGDRMGDYAFINTMEAYHNALSQWAGGFGSGDPNGSRLPKPASPFNATYGRGLDAYMQAVATREANQQANIPVDPFARELRPASVSFDVRGANAGPEWHGKAWGAGSAPTQGVGPWSSADYRNESDIESDNYTAARQAEQLTLANNRTVLNAANVAADPSYYSSPTPEC